MSNTHKILITDNRVLSAGNGVQPVLQELDLPANFGHTLQKSVEELNDINEVKRFGAISFSLKKTENNTYLLERYNAVSISNNLYEPLTVEAWVGHIKLPFDRLTVSPTNDRDRTFECELTIGGDFWLELAEKTYIKDLDLGSFTFTKANVLGNMQNNSQYNGGDLIYLPLVDYGNGGTRIPFTESSVNIDDGGSSDTITLPDHGLPVGTGQFFQVIIQSDGTPPAPFANNNIYLFSVVDEEKLLSLVQIADKGSGQHYATLNRWDIRHIRPLFSVPALLTTCFSQLGNGWQLRGDFLGHPDVNRWWSYLLGKEFYNTGGNEAYYYFLAERNTEYTTASPFLVQYENAVNEEYGTLVDDVPSGYTNANYLNDTGEKLDAELTATILVENLSANNAVFSFQLSVWEDNTPTAQELFRETESATLLPSQPITITVVLQAELKPGNIANITATQTGGAPINIKVLASTSLRVQPREYPKYIVKNSTHELAKMVDSEMTVLDALKGFLHLGDFKLKTDYLGRAVTIYTSENTTYEGTALEGYWKPLHLSIDKSSDIVKNSRISTPPDEDQPRLIHLKFKDSTDDYITEELDTSETTGLYGRTIDLGERFKGEPLSIENPFYEPTAEKQSGGAVVPAMWDNTNGRESRNIKPRIVYAIGWTRQKLLQTYTAHSNSLGQPTPPYVVDESFWYFEGGYYTEVPYVSQLPTTKVFSALIPAYLPAKNIVYGTEANDLFVSFWERGRFLRFSLPSVAFLVLMTTEGFTAEDFRFRWFIYYNGEPSYYRPLLLSEHETNNDDPTEALLVPETT